MTNFCCFLNVLGLLFFKTYQYFGGFKAKKWPDFPIAEPECFISGKKDHFFNNGKCWPALQSTMPSGQVIQERNWCQLSIGQHWSGDVWILKPGSVGQSCPLVALFLYSFSPLLPNPSHPPLTVWPSEKHWQVCLSWAGCVFRPEERCYSCVGRDGWESGKPG